MFKYLQLPSKNKLPDFLAARRTDRYRKLVMFFLLEVKFPYRFFALTIGDVEGNLILGLNSRVDWFLVSGTQRRNLFIETFIDSDLSPRFIRLMHLTVSSEMISISSLFL